MNWQAMGLAHLKPFQPCFVIPPSEPPELRKQKKHPALETREYRLAISLCDTRQEKATLRKRVIRVWERERILRVNRHTDLGAHGGLSKGQKAPR